MRRGGAQSLEDNTLKSEDQLPGNTTIPVKQVNLKKTEASEQLASVLQVFEVKQARKLNSQAEEETASISTQDQFTSEESLVPRQTKQLQINPIMNTALSNDEFRETYGILDLAWEENEKNDPDHKITKQEYESIIESTMFTKFRKDKIPSILEAWESYFNPLVGKNFYIDNRSFQNSPLHHKDIKWVIVEFDKDLDLQINSQNIQEGGAIELNFDDFSIKQDVQQDYFLLHSEMFKNKRNLELENLKKWLTKTNVERLTIQNSLGSKEDLSVIEKSLLQYPGANKNARTFAFSNPRYLLRSWLKDWETWTFKDLTADIYSSSFFPFAIYENVAFKHETTSDDPNRTPKINMFVRTHGGKIFKMWVFFNEVSLPDQYVYDYTGRYSYHDWAPVLPKLWGPNFLKNIMNWYWYMYKPGYDYKNTQNIKDKGNITNISNRSQEIRDNPKLRMWNLLDIYRNYNLHDWTPQLFQEYWYQDMFPFVNSWAHGFGRQWYSYWWTYSGWFLGNKRNDDLYKNRWKYINKLSNAIYNSRQTWSKQKQYSLYV